MKLKYINNINPATGKLIKKVKCSTEKEIDKAVANARAAQKKWAALSLAQRSKMLEACAKDFVKQKEKIGRIITDEMGKLYKSAVGETHAVAYGIRETIEQAKTALAVENLQEENLRTELHRTPLGVCAIITPWNFPVSMPESLLSPALIAGNTVVFKPSEMVPLTGKAIFDIFNKHLPKGVINLVQGADEVGNYLIHSNIDMIAFVGSQAVGKIIMKAAGDKLKRIVLELGGKDPMIVLNDADLEKAANFAVNGSLRNTGQVCVSVERIYVQEKAADKFTTLVANGVKNFKYGSGYDESVHMGPLVSERQRANVLSQVKEAVKKGAKLVTGGKAPKGNKGFFMEPTLLTNLSHKHRIMNEETFGPVVAIQKVKTEDEAVKLANDSPFGLGATVWTKNKKKGLAIARKIESGMIGVNQGIGAVSGTPWVGVKQSGYGYIGSIDGIRQFTVPRKISYKK
ncbi:MAG TPA: aldehyde dehydrogenase family protein [Ignavibacteria bacterium]|nr:aldehyde dehydrogenase family protein [Ignavibacteria bacterium]HRF67046.1 aldehyde dehydrogenase family protein [Ignavibacteria bacterium]HRJ04056.1 aldehyde dehydrogenase family protein [Ignavibacteria bacterium]